jgi:hypothetical protein
MSDKPTAKELALGNLMQLRADMANLERLIDSEATYDAQVVAADVNLEAARLMANVERWHAENK